VTLIVGQRTGPMHFMLGDLLLSSAVPANAAVLLPTRFDTQLPAVDLRIRGLCQKIFCVNQQVAIGWAGDFLVARHISRALAN
jgi:hypothetical protein